MKTKTAVARDKFIDNVAKAAEKLVDEYWVLGCADSVDLKVMGQRVTITDDHRGLLIDTYSDRMSVEVHVGGLPRHSPEGVDQLPWLRKTYRVNKDLIKACRLVFNSL